MITIERFREIEAAVIAAGYSEQIAWCEALEPPIDAETFASEAIYVIINAGMKNSVARPIFARVMTALRRRRSCKAVYGHPGKVAAINKIWKERQQLFAEFQTAEDVVAFCATLPFTGQVTKFHLARNLGEDFAKPDVHLNRLAEAERTTAQELCDRLARESGYRAATIDLILWRACADGIIDPRQSLENLAAS